MTTQHDTRLFRLPGRLFFAVLLTVALTIAACGGDDDDVDSAQSADTTQSDDTTESDATTSDDDPATTNDDTDTDSNDSATPTGDALCDSTILYLQHTLDFTNAFFASDAAAIEATSDLLRDDMVKVRAELPADVIDDFDTASDHFTEQLDAIEATDYDVEAAAPIFNEPTPPEVSAAEDRMNEFLESECELPTEMEG